MIKIMIRNKRVFFVLLGRFGRWDVRYPTAALLSSVALRIYSKQQVSFFPIISFEYKICNHRVEQRVIAWKYFYLILSDSFKLTTQHVK